MRFAHVERCARRPVLRQLTGSGATAVWVDGVLLGMVTGFGPKSRRSFVARTAAGERVPSGRLDGLWTQAAGVNALVRAAAVAQDRADAVDLDALRPRFADPT